MILEITGQTDDELTNRGLNWLGFASTQADAVNVAHEALGELYAGRVTLQRLDDAGRRHYAVWADHARARPIAGAVI
jgi:hypothetical protein